MKVSDGQTELYYVITPPQGKENRRNKQTRTNTNIKYWSKEKKEWESYSNQRYYLSMKIIDGAELIKFYDFLWF